MNHQENIDIKLKQLCHDHKIPIDESYGSLYITLRYWFSMGYEIGYDQATIDDGIYYKSNYDKQEDEAHGFNFDH